MYISNTQKYYDKISPCQTRKGKALIGPVEGRIFKKFSKRTSDQIKSSKKDKKSFDSDDRSPFKARKEKRSVYSFTSEEFSPLKARKARKSFTSEDSSPLKARKARKSFTSEDNSPLKARKSFTSEDSSPLKARKSLTSEDSSPLKARKSFTTEDSSPLIARTSFTSKDSSPLKAIKGSRDKKSFDSDDRSPLKARKSLNSKDSSPYKARNDLNNPIDVCPNLERTSETTGEYERIGKNTKKDAITGLINHSSTKDKKSEIGRKRSGNKKIYTAESKKCTVRLTDIGTIKNLKTYVNKTEKKRKRRKICVKNL
ncbi:neurofilament heavy polypeptide-like isoform X5 [Mytilus trossulus]|uniref:neurofilament heavy polypeptide-like isoform X5 n=1 Tax=Mytilus trossulus TaxID=6551 RepID=UPI003004B938